MQEWSKQRYYFDKERSKQDRWQCQNMKARFSIVKASFNNLVMIIEMKGNVQEAFLFVSFSTEGRPWGNVVETGAAGI